MKDVNDLAKKLGIKFKNTDFLLNAVTHRSYLNEHPSFSVSHNERLEFLGDAVIELSVTEFLYQSYPNPEGDLTNWRASLVNANTLGELAKDLGIEEYLLLSKGESKDKKSKARLYILANAFEAVVGAIYLDRGMGEANKFLEKHLFVMLPEILENKSYLDPKSRFQEIAQEKFSVTPAYKVLKETGPDHAKVFVVGVYIADEKIAEGEGMSKHEAQVEAAKNGLAAKGWR
ncbi:MAG: ribonuclease III [Patescibacteria group bacterium]